MVKLPFWSQVSVLTLLIRVSSYSAVDQAGQAHRRQPRPAFAFHFPLPRERPAATSLETLGSGAHEDDQNLSVTDDWISLTNPSVVILSVLKLDSEHKE